MNKFPLTVQEVAEIVGGQVEGDGSVRLEGLGALGSTRPGELTYAADERHGRRLKTSRAAAAIVSQIPKNVSMPLIRVGNVQAAVARLLGALGGEEDRPPAGVDPSAIVDPSAQLGESVAVGPGAVVGAGAKLGSGTVLCANVVIGRGCELGQDCFLQEGVVLRAKCTLGKRVRIGANSVIGSDGYGYYFADGVHHRIPHIGTVTIEDDVEIGACTCVDRAKFGATRVGAGSKIDNLVQIAHNVQLGRGCLLAALAGVAGSAQLGDYVVLGGQAGIRDNIRLTDGVKVGACSCVAQSINEPQDAFGIPALPARQELRIQMARRKLPDLLKRVKALEAKLRNLDSAKDH